ncbi:hypothetical protein CS542_07870 [Pedobacter sp. IW39]|nr:hypothetical protein CS542_07870 [Pedobacter sp. IW39]
MPAADCRFTSRADRSLQCCSGKFTISGTALRQADYVYDHDAANVASQRYRTSRETGCDLH